MDVVYFLGTCQKLNNEQFKMYLEKMNRINAYFNEGDADDVFIFQNLDREMIDFCIENKYCTSIFFTLPQITDNDRIKYINDDGDIRHIIGRDFVSREVVKCILDKFKRMINDWKDWSTLEYYFEDMNYYFYEYDLYKEHVDASLNYSGLERMYTKIKEEYERVSEE